MATGLLIRDFFKEYRELRYSNSGSIELSEIEHNAYRASLTLEITHIDAPRYGSLKTLPENTHYGYVTLFRGSTVTDTIAIKYPKFRVFDINNQGIWNYHQSTESLQLNAGVAVTASNASSSGILGKLGDLVTGTICFLVGIETASTGGGPAGDFTLDFFDCSEPDGGTRDITKRYRGYPVATPFPDIVKFKADVPCSFLFRFETWYLVNPAVYIVDNPTDTSDETDGEDEYPVPEQGDGDGDGSEFPDSDPIPDGADPRDFSGGAGGAFGTTNFQISWKAYGDPQSNLGTGAQEPVSLQLAGQWDESAVSFGCGGFATTPVAGTFCVRPRIFLNGVLAWEGSFSVPPDWVTDVRVFNFQN